MFWSVWSLIRMLGAANWRSRRNPLQASSALDWMTEDSPLHKVESAALAFRFISDDLDLSLDSTSNERCDLRSEELDSPMPSSPTNAFVRLNSPHSERFPRTISDALNHRFCVTSCREPRG